MALFTATDSGSASVANTFNLTVTNTNDAPTLANAISDQTVAEDLSFSACFCGCGLVIGSFSDEMSFVQARAP